MVGGGGGGANARSVIGGAHDPPTIAATVDRVPDVPIGRLNRDLAQWLHEHPYNTFLSDEQAMWVFDDILSQWSIPKRLARFHLWFLFECRFVDDVPYPEPSQSGYNLVLFNDCAVKYGHPMVDEYQMPCGFPGYEIAFGQPGDGTHNALYRLVMVPHSPTAQPYFLLLDGDVANASRPHLVIHAPIRDLRVDQWWHMMMEIRQTHRLENTERRVERDRIERERKRLEMGARQVLRQKGITLDLLSHVTHET